MNHNAVPDASQVEVPALLVWGTRDPILPWWIDGRRAKKSLPHVQVVKLPCGHQAFAEMPDEFLVSLEQFLGSKGEGST